MTSVQKNGWWQARFSKPVGRKIERARQRAVMEYGDTLRTMFVMGSITGEPTEVSDIDINLVFEGEYYDTRVSTIRSELRRFEHELPLCQYE